MLMHLWHCLDHSHHTSLTLENGRRSVCQKCSYPRAVADRYHTILTCWIWLILDWIWVSLPASLVTGSQEHNCHSQKITQKVIWPTCCVLLTLKGHLVDLGPCWHFFKHPMTYICPQSTTSHHAQKLIYHCVLIVSLFREDQDAPLNQTLLLHKTTVFQQMALFTFSPATGDLKVRRREQENVTRPASLYSCILFLPSVAVIISSVFDFR